MLNQIIANLIGGGAGGIMTGGLNAYEVADISEGVTDGSLIKVEGRKLGLWVKIAEMIGLGDPTFSMDIDKNFLTIVKGNKDYTICPMKEIHTFNCGYSNDKKLIVMAIGFLFAALGALFTAGIVPFIIMLVFAAIFLFLYKMSEALAVSVTTMRSDKTSATMGVRLKSSLTGIRVSKEQLKTTLDIMKHLTQNHSKFY
jgi:hypothetical protein